MFEQNHLRRHSRCFKDFDYQQQSDFPNCERRKHHHHHNNKNNSNKQFWSEPKPRDDFSREFYHNHHHHHHHHSERKQFQDQSLSSQIGRRMKLAEGRHNYYHFHHKCSPCGQFESFEEPKQKCGEKCLCHQHLERKLEEQPQLIGRRKRFPEEKCHCHHKYSKCEQFRSFWPWQTQNESFGGPIQQWRGERKHHHRSKRQFQCQQPQFGCQYKFSRIRNHHWQHQPILPHGQFGETFQSERNNDHRSQFSQFSPFEPFVSCRPSCEQYKFGHHHEHSRISNYRSPFDVSQKYERKHHPNSPYQCQRLHHQSLCRSGLCRSQFIFQKPKFMKFSQKNWRTIRNRPRDDYSSSSESYEYSRSSLFHPFQGCFGKHFKCVSKVMPFKNHYHHDKARHIHHCHKTQW